MTLVKKNIRINKVKGKIVSQITLDDDINISENAADIGHKITESENVIIDSVKVYQNKAGVIGKLCFKMMYGEDGKSGSIHRVEGKLDFDESINMEGIEEGDNISVDVSCEDLNITIVNSRKISVKAILTVNIIAENICNEDVATDISEEDVENIKESVKLTQLAIRKKDLLRIKEEINLATGKQNVNEIIWNTSSIFNEKWKLLEDKILISGEMKLFVLYNSEDGALQWMDANIPFSSEIDVPGCSDEMIPSIELKQGNMELTVRPDYDGENRMILIDGIINISIKLYEEENFEIISDAYSREKEIILETKEIQCENLVMKNITKCKFNEKIKIDNPLDYNILQICNCNCEPQVDDISLTNDGLIAEGVLQVRILYVSNDDSNPMNCVKKSIPFSQKIDVNNILENSIYNIRTTVDNVTASMTGGDEIEIRAAILLDCIVFENNKKEVITEMTEQEYDMERINSLPGIVCYVVKEGDTKWSIAKKFYTTIEMINSVNDLKGDSLKVGDMLVLVKK